MLDAPRPVTLLVGASSAEPIRVLVEGYGLRMVVVNKSSLRLLGDEWNVPGVYILLGRPQDPDRYTAYVGKAATQGLRQRVSQHVRTEKNWDRALLIHGDEFDSGAVSYLEGRFYDVLKNAAAADVLNGQAPWDETLQSYRRAILDRYAEPVTLAMRALGCPPDTADQEPPQGVRPRRVFSESVLDLIENGLLRPGTRLRPVRDAYDEPATVRADGTLEVSGQTYSSVSAAGSAVSGKRSEAGWGFWAAPSGDGTMVTLSDLRSRLRAGAVGDPQTDVAASSATASPDAPSMPDAGRDRPGANTSRKTGRRYNVTLQDLLAAGMLTAGEPLTMLRKRFSDVRASLNEDGKIAVNDETYSSPSGAAQAVTGSTAEPGWGTWGVRREGVLVALMDIRAAYLERRGDTV